MAKLQESEVVKAVNAELERSKSFMENRIAFERAAAYDYYYGREFGNEVDGRSRVVSADVAQAVDSAVPAIVKIFVSGDKAVEFTPRGAEDVEAAEQATSSCNYVFFTQNNGYALAHDFIKDGLLSKTGVFKWKWDTSIQMQEKRYQGLDDQTLALLDKDPDTDIIEHTEYPDEVAMVAMQQAQAMGQQVPPQPPMLHDVTVRVKKEAGKVKIIVPPPEDIQISPDSMSLDVMDMPFIAHTPLLTGSDLREMGIEQKVIDELPEGDRDELTDPERVARRDRNDAATSLLDGEDDEGLTKVYRYNECYIRLDVDGDGIAELRKVCMVGDTVLHNEPVDHIPLCIWTPKVMPHEVVGISLADDVMDIQLLKSTIWRQALDNLYLSNAPRLFVKGDVNMDDILTVKPGGVIRGEANSEVVPVVVPFTAGESFNMLEYADQEEEVRTGISRLFQGIDPQSINKTATGVTAIMNQANARVELIARNAAEFGFKPLFKGIMYLLAKHQQKALMVRVNNKFVPIDPETWTKEYDMSCNVGLGMGTKDQQLMHLQALGMDLQAIGQSPFAQQLLDANKIFNYVQKKAELAGFRDVTPFLNDPTGMPPPPPPPPPPEIQKAQMQIEADKQKFQAQSQMDMQKMGMEQQAGEQKMQQEGALQMQKAQIDAEVARYKAELDAQVKIQVEQMRMQLEHERESRRIEVDGQVGLKSAEMTAKVAGVKMEPEDDGAEDDKESKRDQLILAALQQMTEALSRPKQIVRGKDGRAIGVQ